MITYFAHIFYPCFSVGLITLAAQFYRCMTAFQFRITFFLFFLATTAALAQSTGTIRGFVYDRENGEPVIFTNVYLENTTYGASTDVNGYYSISKVPPGGYTLLVTAVGYDTTRVELTVGRGEILNERLLIGESSVQMQEFEVSAERQEAQTKVQMSVQKITPREMKRLPSIGGEPDLAQYLQVLPGVIFTGDQGGQLYIRGGSPIQNKVLLDGVTIFQPFHSIGLFSVFETDLIRNADIYTGGFGARYGGRVSSVMDITTRDGNKRHLSGLIGATTFGAKALIEGPIKKQTDEGYGSSSFVISAKHSYLDQSSKLLYNYIDEDGLPFNYTDLYGKVSINTGNGSKVNFFGFSFNDQVSYQALSNLKWRALGGGTNFVLIPGGSSTIMEGNFSISDYKIELSESELPPRTSSINNFDLGLRFKYFTGEDEFKYGVSITGFSSDFSFFNQYNLRIDQESTSTEIAGFLSYTARLGNLILEPSFRLHYYGTLSKASPEPRLGVKYNVTEFFRLKGAGGLYSQNLIAANSDRDVVNLFYGYLASPSDLPQTFVLEDGSERDVNNPLQRSAHAIVGFEWDITRKLNLNVEGYYKHFPQITNMNRNKKFESDDPTAPDALKKDFVVESGKAYGVDFVLKFEERNYYIWAVYSLGYTDRWDGFQSYNPVFDRRHNVNLVASYTFGKKKLWSADVRWNFGSGFPFTQSAGYYGPKPTFLDGINTGVEEVNSSGVEVIYGELNGGRLPDYHRLDFSLKRVFNISDRSKIEASLSVTNIYDRENIFYIDRVRFETVYQLPLMPSLGVNWRF